MTENRVVINLVLASSFLFLSEQSSNILSLEKLISMNPSGVINKNFVLENGPVIFYLNWTLLHAKQ